MAYVINESTLRVVVAIWVCANTIFHLQEGASCYFNGTILPHTYPIFYFDGGYSGLRVKGFLQKHTS